MVKHPGRVSRRQRQRCIARHSGRPRHLGVLHCRRIDADFIGARVEQSSYVLDAADTSAHRHRDEDLRRHSLDDVENEIAFVAACSDVQKRELVGALVIVALRDFHWISSVAQLDKSPALNDAARGDVEARDDAFG
jgi:hypothetical protein